MQALWEDTRNSIKHSNEFVHISFGEVSVRLFEIMSENVASANELKGKMFHLQDCYNPCLFRNETGRKSPWISSKDSLGPRVWSSDGGRGPFVKTSLSPIHCSAPTISQLFLDHVFKLHGMPLLIVSDRDPIFASTFWRELFTLKATKLKHNLAYHPQTSGQSSYK